MPEHLLTFLPLNTEMIYAAALALGGEEACRILNWWWGGMLMAAAAALAARLAAADGSRAALGPAMAAFLLVSLPVTMVENEICFADNSRAVWESLALLWAVRGASGRPAALPTAAVMMGLGMGAKYLAVVRGAALAVALAWSATSRQKGIRLAVAWTAAAALVLSPWLGRNWLVGGDPVYPFLGTLFEPLWFSAAEFERWMTDNTHYGVETLTVRAWLTLPLRACLEPGDRDFGTFALSPLPLGLAPLLLLRRRWTYEARTVLWCLAVEALTWSFTSHLIRYLLPGLAAGAALGGWLADRAAAENRRMAHVLAILALSWTVPVLVMRVHHRYNLDDQTGALGATLGRLVPTTVASDRGFGPEFARLPAGTVLLVGEDRVLGLGRRWRGGSVYNRQLVKRWAEESNDGRRFSVRARQARVTAVLLNGEGFLASQGRGPAFRLSDRELAVLNPWWRRLRVVYQAPPWTGHAVVARGVQ